MGLFDKFKSMLGGADKRATPARFDLTELARRLDLPLEQIQAVQPQYRTFQIPKRRGGMRTLDAPEKLLGEVQRRILRRVFGRLRAHPAAHGFERGRSIVTNARPHTGAAVIVKFDLIDFFTTTTAERIRQYFRGIGWDDDSAALLTKLCTHRGGLPQGAPTSPRLSNLVNVLLDARLSSLARFHGATYTRYADDLSFSFARDDHRAVSVMIKSVEQIVQKYGYGLHYKKKLEIRRRHQQQRVTGLVVNAGVRLPRTTRRWLRAVEHHVATGKPVSLSAAELSGWRGLQTMIETQAAGTE